MKVKKKEDAKLKLLLSLFCFAILVFLVFSLIQDYTIKGSIGSLSSAVKEKPRIEVSDLIINPASNTANFIWKTNIPTFSRIDYGKTSRLGDSKIDSETTIYHVVNLKGLEITTQYYYMITSCDVDGRCENTKVKTFSTLESELNDKTPPVISNINLNAYGKSAAVLYDTDELSTTAVYYGEYPKTDLVVMDSEYTTRHITNLKNLNPKTNYAYLVRSCDVRFNCAYSQLAIFETTQ